MSVERLEERGGWRRRFRTSVAYAALVACATLAPVHLSAQPAPDWVLELRIGAVDGESALTRVGHVVPLPDGSIAIAQPMESTVRVFSPSGAATGSAVRWERYPAGANRPDLHIDLPARSRIVAADGPVVWIREMDGLDVEYIARYRHVQ